jgi:hypothetical protein
MNLMMRITILMKCRLIASSESELKEMIDLLRCDFLVTNLSIRKSSHPKYPENQVLAYFDLGIN